MTLGQTLRAAWNEAYAAAMAKPDKRLPEWQQQENAGLHADMVAADAIAAEWENYLRSIDRIKP